MADTSHARGRDLAVLAIMYVVQGLPIGLAFSALGVLIRQAGHPIADVGLTGFAFLPWALKFLWAAPVDNIGARHGYRVPILALQAMAVMVGLVAAFFDPVGKLAMAIAMVTVLNGVFATQDILSNAFAVSRLQGRAAGPANAVQIAGFLIGGIAGGPGFLFLHSAAGWSGAMVALAMMVAVLGLGEAVLLDASSSTSRRQAPVVRLRDLLRHQDLAWSFALALAFKFGGTAASTLLSPWLVDQRLSLPEIGQIQLLMQLATAAGAVLIGIPLIGCAGARLAVVIAVPSSALMLGVPFLLDRMGHPSVTAIYALLGCEGLIDGAMYAAIWALVMNWASPERPGTDFTAMQCCESVANMAGAATIGGLLQGHGYAIGFAAAWGSGAIAAVLVVVAALRLRLVSSTPAI